LALEGELKTRNEWKIFLTSLEPEFVQQRTFGAVKPVQLDKESWNARLLNYIRQSIPYLPYLVLLLTIVGIFAAFFLKMPDLALKGVFLIFPALLASFILQPICKKDLAFHDSITLFSCDRKYLLTLFACLFSITLVILAVGFGNLWIYPALVALLYVIILIQIFSGETSRVTLLSEVMLTQAGFIWSSIQKYDFYFGGTDIMPHQFMATITYLSGRVLPPEFGGYTDFPLYHIFVAECSHILGIDIGTAIFSFTWPISVIGVIFVHYIFLHTVRNEQIALLTCLIYSMSAIGLTHSIYMIPRSLAFVGFLMLLYFMTSSNRFEKPYAKCVLVTLIGVFTVLVHQVSILLIITLLCLLIVLEWIVGQEKYVTDLSFIFIAVTSVGYWVYVAFSFARSTFTSRLNTDLWENPVVLRATDLLPTDPMVTWSYYINSIGTEVFLFLAVIAIGYILWRKKYDSLTVLALFALITLVLYVPNPLHMVWQLERLLAINRFNVLLGPFMALIMGAGVYILSQYLLRVKIPIRTICTLVIVMILLYGLSTTGLLKVDPSINRDNFNSDEVEGLDFVYRYIPYGATIHTDYFSQRYLGANYFSESETLGLPYFSTGMIGDLNNIPSYSGYIVLPYKEFMRRGLTLGVGSEFVQRHIYPCYPTEENIVSTMVGLESRDKLYSNQAIMIYV
jgi:hypothetical protein